jgi:prepilin-type N-terminal cleavage/methylation domain-containing protein
VAVRRVRRLRGMSMIETLAAVLIVGIAAAAAVATWGLALRVVANKRVTEMTNYLGTREIERLKAKKFSFLSVSNTPLVTYYDKTGASAAGAVAEGFKVESTVSTAVSRPTTGGAGDVHEIQVQVWSSDGTTRYDDGNIRTLLSTGGL